MAFSWTNDQWNWDRTSKSAESHRGTRTTVLSPLLRVANLWRVDRMPILPWRRGNREREGWGARKKRERGEIKKKEKKNGKRRCVSTRTRLLCQLQRKWQVRLAWTRAHTREPRIIPPMFHYTVNHRVCPEALARKPIDSFSSTEPNRFRRFRFIKGLQSSTVWLPFRACARVS